jgi:hypothetical protein
MVQMCKGFSVQYVEEHILPYVLLETITYVFTTFIKFEDDRIPYVNRGVSYDGLRIPYVGHDLYS